MMAKKVYNDFARMIRTQKHQLEHLTESMPDTDKNEISGRRLQIDVFMVSIGEMFQSDNPQFNAEKFIKACQITE